MGLRNVGAVRSDSIVRIQERFKDSILLREVRITAPGKTPLIALRMTRPDSMAIHAEITGDISDILSKYTPVYIRNYGPGSMATASFRGTAASHAQVIWNGMKLNSPALGYTDLSLLPLYFTDDVYLLHGGSTLAKSSGALGGSIHLDSSPEWNRKFLASGMLEAGSFSSRKLMGRVQTGNNRFNSVSRAYFDASENDFPFINSGVIPKHRDTLKNGDFRKGAFLQEFNLRMPGNFISSLRFWYQKSQRNLPALMSYEGYPRIEYQHDNQKRVQYQGKLYRGKSILQFFTGVNQSGMHYFRQTMQMNYVMDDAASRETSWYTQAEFTQEMSSVLKFNTLAEINHHWIWTKDRVRMVQSDKQRLETGLMLYLQFHPSDRIDFYGLARSEFYDGNFIPLIPAAGIEWKVIKELPLYFKANLARNFHKPGLNDLYWIPGGNPELKPEQGISGEFSLISSNTDDDFTFKQECTFFLSRIRNWIIWQPSSAGAWYWEATNLRRALSEGMEYDFHISLKIKRIRFYTTGNYAFTRAVDQDAVSSTDLSRGKQLIYIPRHTGNLHMGISWTEWLFSLDNNYTGKRFTQSSNQSGYYGPVMYPFWLTSISIQKKLPAKFLQIDVKFKVDNLFNTHYQQILWRPMPGRSYSVTIMATILK